MRPSTRCRHTSTPVSTGARCGTLTLAPRPDTHNTTTSAKLTPSRPKYYLRAAPVDLSQRVHPLSRRSLQSTISNGSRCSTLTPRSQARPTRLHVDGRKKLAARATRHHSKYDRGSLPLLGAQASTNTDRANNSMFLRGDHKVRLLNAEWPVNRTPWLMRSNHSLVPTAVMAVLIAPTSASNEN
jgi:hypothetical protein